jgi:diguanylate cyclase (GGDEF)-like protein
MGWWLFQSKVRVIEEGEPQDERGDPKRLRQALARVASAVGREALELERVASHALAQRTEAWARYLLMGGPAPSTLEARGEPPDPLEALAVEVEEVRAAERSRVAAAINELKAALLDTVKRVGAATREDDAEDAEMGKQLDLLASAVQESSPTELRSRVASAVAGLTQTLDRRRERNRDRMSELTQRVKSLRSDLFEARAESVSCPLTGLANRRGLETSLERMLTLAELSSEPLAAVMVDLDHFKRVNDTYGHLGGDAVLKEVARSLIRSFPRKGDVIARYGGEELTVLLGGCTEDEVVRLARRFLLDVQDSPVVYDGQKIQVTCSAGVATFVPGETGAQLLARADRALYAAKQLGRNRVISASALAQAEAGRGPLSRSAASLGASPPRLDSLIAVLEPQTGPITAPSAPDGDRDVWSTSGSFLGR